LIRPRIFLAGDHPDFLKLAMAFMTPHFELVATAADWALLVSEVLRLRPDLVVVDITMPAVSGIDAVQQLVQSGCNAKFIFLTIHSSKEYVHTCLEQGARGFVTKSRMKAHLIPAINAVLDGLPYVASAPAF
jgi:DNA-binding NarL/FixJ family response regulator